MRRSTYLVWISFGDDSCCFKLCFGDVRFISTQVRECVCFWLTQCELCQFCLNQLELNSCCSARCVLCRRQSGHQVLVVVVPSLVISSSCARDCVFMIRDMLRIMAQENLMCSSRPTIFFKFLHFSTFFIMSIIFLHVLQHFTMFLHFSVVLQFSSFFSSFFFFCVSCFFLFPFFFFHHFHHFSSFSLVHFIFHQLSSFFTFFIIFSQISSFCFIFIVFLHFSSLFIIC